MIHWCLSALILSTPMEIFVCQEQNWSNHGFGQATGTQNTEHSPSIRKNLTKGTHNLALRWTKLSDFGPISKQRALPCFLQPLHAPPKRADVLYSKNFVHF